MKSIADFYSDNKEILITELGKDLSPNKIEEKIISFFNDYFLLLKKDSNINDTRKMAFVMDIIKSSISTILSVKDTKLYLLKEYKKQKGNKKLYSFLSIIAVLLLARQLVIFFLAGFSKPFNIILITPLIYFLMIIYIHIYDKIRICEGNFFDKILNIFYIRKIDKANVVTDKYEIQTNIKLDLFIIKFEDLIKTINKFIINEMQSIKKVQSSEKKELLNIELLEFLQDLLEGEQNNDQIFINKKIKEINIILSNYDIEIKQYNSLNNANRSYFRFEESLIPNSKDYKTIKPAFTRNNKCILKGIVSEPNKGRKL